MQRHTMVEITNRSLGTVSNFFTRRKVGHGGGGGGRGWCGGGAKIDFLRPQPLPLVLLWYTQDICSVRMKGF